MNQKQLEKMVEFQKKLNKTENVIEVFELLETLDKPYREK